MTAYNIKNGNYGPEDNGDDNLPIAPAARDVSLQDAIAMYQSDDGSLVDWLADSDSLFGDVKSKPVYLHVWGDRWLLNTLSDAGHDGEIVTKLTGLQRTPLQIVSDVAVMQLS